MTASRHLQRNAKALPRLGKSIDANALDDQAFIGRDGDQHRLLAILSIPKIDHNAGLERLYGGDCTRRYRHIVRPLVVFLRCRGEGARLERDVLTSALTAPCSG